MSTGTRPYSPSSSSGILPPLAQLPERDPHLELREPPHRPIRTIAPPDRDDPHVLVRRQAVLPRLARDCQRPLALQQQNKKERQVSHTSDNEDARRKRATHLRSGAILLAHEEREEVAPREPAPVLDELRRRLQRLARELHAQNKHPTESSAHAPHSTRSQGSTHIRPSNDDLSTREHLPLIDLDLRALDTLHDDAVRRPLLLDVQTVLEPEPDAPFGARRHRARKRGVDVERERHVRHFGAVVARAAAARDRRATDCKEGSTGAR